MEPMYMVPVNADANFVLDFLYGLYDYGQFVPQYPERMATFTNSNTTSFVHNLPDTCLHVPGTSFPAHIVVAHAKAT